MLAANSASRPHPRLVVLICTRNRPEFLKNLLTSLSRQTQPPEAIFVVDSSADLKTAELVQGFEMLNVTELVYEHSEPGLPHQRNVGLARIISHGFKLDLVVSFLDDDVQVDEMYLERVNELFEKYPEVFFIGGFARDAKPEPDSFARRIALLSGKDSAGKILKSGVCHAARPSSELQEVDWVPGHSMNARLEIFQETLFNPGPRIYGEDVEFQIRLAKNHRIFSSNLLAVSHNQALTNRDQLADLEAFSDGFRWSLARRKLGGVRAWAVLWATFSMILGLAFLGLAQGQSDTLERIKGHLKFLKRILLGQETQQLIR